VLSTDPTGCRDFIGVQPDCAQIATDRSSRIKFTQYAGRRFFTGDGRRVGILGIVP
jgi:hypothetical protein